MLTGYYGDGGAVGIPDGVKGDVCKYKIVAYITVSGTDYVSSAVVKTVNVK